MNNFRSSGRAYRTSVKGMRQESDILSRRLEVQRERVAELKRRYDESREATGENSARTKDLAAQYNNAQAQMKRTEQQLGRLNELIRVQESRWTRLGEHLDTAGQRMQTFGRATTRFGQQYTMRVTTPILGAGIAALKVGMDFEEGMSRVQAISGASGEELAKLTEQAKQLGESTRFSAREAADGMEFLARAGWNTSEIMAGMPGLLDLAASSAMDLGNAADITSNIMSAFNIEAEKAGYVADVLAHAAANANTDVEQMGEAMKYLAPTANTVGLSIEDTAAAIMSVSDAGIQGSMAGRAFSTSLLRLSKPTDQMEKEMKKLGVSFFDAEGAMKPLPDIIGQLEKGMKDYDKEQRAAALSTIFGTEAQRHWAILLDDGSKKLARNSKELENSEGAAARMAKVMQDNAKGAMVEFRSALEGAGIAAAEHVIPALTDIVHSATDLVRKFGELDKEQQQQILRWAAIAGAIGPVAIVVGNLSTALGGILKAGGSVAKMLGRASGTGLVARIASLGPLGVGGLAIAGVTGLGTAIYQLAKNTEDTLAQKLNYIQTQLEEVESTEELINAYDELREKNKLTSDEMLRYMDILTELENTTSDEKINKLTKEQQELLEKSGLTNEEMQEFLKLNDEIIEKTPGQVEAISEQGNAYAGVAKELRELTQAERERLVGETYDALTSEITKQADRLEKQKQLTEELKELEKDRSQAVKEITDMTQNIEHLDREILELEKELVKATGDEVYEIGEKLAQKEYERGLEEDKLKQMRKTLENLAKEIDKKEESIEKNEKELELFKQLSDEYAQQVLYEQGIVSERGKANEALREEQKEIDKARRKLEEKRRTGKIGTAEYEEQNKKLREQQNRIDTARSKLEQMNKVAGETIYKDINIDTSPSIPTLTQQLSSPISRIINLTTRGGQVSAYADGTSSHHGGPFIAGEEGFELGRMGNKWEMLNFGLYDRPRGYQVFTHEESKRILRALNTPFYADGARPRNEANRVIRDLNDNRFNQTKQPLIVQLVTPDERILAEMVVDDVTEIQERNKRVRESFA